MQWIDKHENFLESLVRSVNVKFPTWQELTNRQHRQLVKHDIEAGIKCDAYKAGL